MAISWRTRAELPLPRAGYAAGTVNGRFVLAGGSYWSEGRKLRNAAVDIYDPLTNRWTGGPALPAPLSDASSATIGDSLYVIGGLTDERPSLNTLILRGAEWAAVPRLRLPEPKIRAASAADRTHIYLVGGQQQFDDKSASDQVWVCDVNSPSPGWSQLPPFPAGPHVVSAAAVWRDGLYIFGGYRIEPSGTENLRDIWRLDTGAHTWAPAGELSEGRRAFWAHAAGGQILLFGGYTDAFSPAVQVYEPRTGALRAAGRLPQGVADAKFLPIRDRWYTAGGEVGIKIRGRHTWEGVAG